VGGGVTRQRTAHRRALPLRTCWQHGALFPFRTKGLRCEHASTDTRAKRALERGQRGRDCMRALTFECDTVCGSSSLISGAAAQTLHGAGGHDGGGTSLRAARPRHRQPHHTLPICPCPRMEDQSRGSVTSEQREARHARGDPGAGRVRDARRGRRRSAPDRSQPRSARPGVQACARVPNGATHQRTRRGGLPPASRACSRRSASQQGSQADWSTPSELSSCLGTNREESVPSRLIARKRPAGDARARKPGRRGGGRGVAAPARRVPR